MQDANIRQLVNNYGAAVQIQIRSDRAEITPCFNVNVGFGKTHHLFEIQTGKLTGFHPSYDQFRFALLKIDPSNSYSKGLHEVLEKCRTAEVDDFEKLEAHGFQNAILLELYLSSLNESKFRGMVEVYSNTGCNEWKIHRKCTNSLTNRYFAGTDQVIAALECFKM